MNKKILFGAGIAAGMLAVLSVRNYRRFTLKPQPLGPVAYDVEVQKLSIQADKHALYGEMLLPKGKSLALCPR